MARFLVQPGQHGVTEISLTSGVNRIGRREGNDHLINDPTVSSFHCEVQVDDGAVRVKDLGSTNGTFLDSAPIQEANLLPGQTLRLGSVEMVLEGAVGNAVVVSPPTARPAIRVALHSPEPTVPVAATVVGSGTVQEAGPNDCRHHPGRAATFVCQRCGTPACPDCVKTQRAAQRTIYSCAACGGLCVNAEAHRMAMQKQQATFFSLLPGAFRYPFRKNGPILLICGTIVFTLAELAELILVRFGRVGFLGFAYWMLLVMTYGYLFAFMQSIIVSSTNGEDEMPGFPEVSNFFDDVFMPFFRFVMIGAVCIGPGIAALIFGGPALGIPVLLLGALCFPMSLLTVSLADSVAGLNPLIIFSGISKVPGPYLVTCAVLLGVTSLAQILEMTLALSGIPLLPMILAKPIGLYGLTVGMRILGLLYYTNKEKLAWYG